MSDGVRGFPAAGRAVLVALGSALTISCSGGDGGPTAETGTIQLALNPSAISVAQGETGNVTATLTRTAGFASDVVLAVSGLPAGVSETVTPAQLSASTTYATVSNAVAPSVAAGTYTATVTATGQGVTPASATYQLTVTAPPPPVGRAVEYRFCTPSQAPVFFAYQDGSGPWRAVTGATADGSTRFAFSLAQELGGVLAVFRTNSTSTPAPAALGAAPGPPPRIRTWQRWARRGGAGAVPAAPALFADVYHTQVMYGSTSELIQDGTDYCELTGPTKAVTGTVAGLAFGQIGIVSLGGPTELFLAGTSTNPVTFLGVPAGRVDLVASRVPRAGDPPDRVVVFRDLDIPDRGALPSVIDFSAATATVPALANATISGGESENFELLTEVVTANSRGVLFYDLVARPTATRPWAGLGPSVRASSDLHGLAVFATPTTGSSTDYRFAVRYLGAVTDQTIALGPPMPAVSSAQVAAGTYPRYRVQGAIPTEYARGAWVDVIAPEGTGNGFSVVASTAHLTAAGNGLAYDFTMPDVVGLPGFPGAARLTAGTNELSAGAYGFTGTGIFDVRPALGSELRGAARGVTIQVP